MNAPPRIRATRLLDHPIIAPHLHPSIGVNIQGPSMIRVPAWVENPLGAIYLYFADHKGRSIRLAYADAPTGPWHIHPPGALTLEQSGFPTQPLEASDQDVLHWEAGYQAAGPLSHDIRSEITTPHIASPDVHVDEARRRIVMVFHGLESLGHQASRIALSPNGIHFTTRPQLVGPSYMRLFPHAGITYALAMPGQFSRSTDGLGPFEPGPTLFNPNMRHAALLQHDGALLVFWTEVGEAPERIKVSRIALGPDWTQWRDEPPIELLRPERPWEGAQAPLIPSVRSTAHGLVNQLRDPAIFVDGHDTYLLYAVGGESGIAIARLDLTSP